MLVKIDKDQVVPIFRAFTYDEYVEKMEALVKDKSTSGSEQSEEKISATSINLQRMRRIIKEATIGKNLSEAITALKNRQQWLVITEAWCGDAAQNLPIIYKVAENSDNKIALKLVFRDENYQLMDQFLTNGARAIPRVICMNEAGEVVNTWGPRPQPIQEALTKFKADNPFASHKDIMYHVHLNYFHDKGCSLQNELVKLLNGTICKVKQTDNRH